MYGYSGRNQDMHLSEQEKKQAARAAKEYYQSLTEEEKRSSVCMRERSVQHMKSMHWQKSCIMR